MNVICVFLIALVLITGYYTVTNSKNSAPNFNPNNMEKPTTSNDLSTNNLIILGICTFVLITSLSIIVDSSSSVYKTAPMFFITNTKSTINLENTTLTYGSNILLSIKGTNEWENSGSNDGNLN